MLYNAINTVQCYYDLLLILYNAIVPPECCPNDVIFSCLYPGTSITYAQQTAYCSVLLCDSINAELAVSCLLLLVLLN